MNVFRLVPVLTLCAMMVALVVLFDHAPTRATGTPVVNEQRAQRKLPPSAIQQLQMLESRATKEMILY